MCALGNLYSQQGHAARARDILLQAKDEAEALGHETSKVAVSAYLGSVYSQLGDIQRGLSLVRASQAGAKQKGYGGIEAIGGSCRGQYSGVTGSVRGGRGYGMPQADN